MFFSFYVNSFLPRNSSEHLISKSKLVSLIHNYLSALKRMAMTPETYGEKALRMFTERIPSYNISLMISGSPGEPE